MKNTIKFISLVLMFLSIPVIGMTSAMFGSYLALGNKIFHLPLFENGVVTLATLF